MARGSLPSSASVEVLPEVRTRILAIQLLGDAAGVFECFEDCGNGLTVGPSPDTGVAVTVLGMLLKERASPNLSDTPIVGPVRRKRIGRW